MGFFDDDPFDEDSYGVEPHRPPPWSGPPENMVGATVRLDRVLANTGDVALALGRVTAYPTGVELSIFQRRRFLGKTSVRDSFERLRVGVGFPDGRRATADDLSEGEVRLWRQAGGGGGLAHSWRYWLWPLPPEGTLQLAVEWKNEGIEETVVELETAPIREAAARAVELWPDDRPEAPDDEW